MAGPIPAAATAPTMLQMPERAVPAPGQSGPEAAVQEPYKSRVPGLDEDSVNQLSRDEQEMLRTKHKAAEEADKKVSGGRGWVMGMVVVMSVFAVLVESGFIYSDERCELSGI